jgi:hypothetical protein
MENYMPKAMFQFRKQGDEPTLDEVCATFNLRKDQVDSEYGVVQTDSREGLYVVLVDDLAQAQIKEKLEITDAYADPAVGVFSNPQIEPFGPPSTTGAS